MFDWYFTPIDQEYCSWEMNVSYTPFSASFVVTNLGTNENVGVDEYYHAIGRKKEHDKLN